MKFSAYIIFLKLYVCLGWGHRNLIYTKLNLIIKQCTTPIYNAFWQVVHEKIFYSFVIKYRTTVLLSAFLCL